MLVFPVRHSAQTWPRTHPSPGCLWAGILLSGLAWDCIMVARARPSGRAFHTDMVYDLHIGAALSASHLVLPTDTSGYRCLSFSAGHPHRHGLQLTPAQDASGLELVPVAPMWYRLQAHHWSTCNFHSHNSAQDQAVCIPPTRQYNLCPIQASISPNQAAYICPSPGCMHPPPRQCAFARLGSMN